MISLREFACYLSIVLTVTLCPSCGKVVIGRVGFQVVRNDVRKGRCAHCQAPIAGVFK